MLFSLTDRGASRKNSGSGAGGNSSGNGSTRPTPETNGTANAEEMVQDEEDNAPLFYCPGKRGFYAPRQGRASFERLNAFRNVGR